MPLRYLLETNTVRVLIRRPSPALQRRLRSPRASEVALSVVTEMELRYGLARNPALRDQRGHAVVRSFLETRGTPIGPLDLMIVSHALALRATLVTSNLGECKRVPGLRSVDWTK